MHDPCVETREPVDLHECRAGEVEDARKQRQSDYFCDDENGAAEQPMPCGDSVQAEEFCRDENGAGQNESKERPSRPQGGNTLLNGMNSAHGSKSSHYCGGPIPDCFFDEEDGGGQPYEWSEQQTFQFLQGRLNFAEPLNGQAWLKSFATLRLYW